MAFIFCLLAFIASVSGGNSGVANLAHLGGMLTGYIYLKWYPSLMSRLEQTQRRADTSRESDISGMVITVINGKKSFFLTLKTYEFLAFSIIVFNCSGRGDKDLFIVTKKFKDQSFIDFLKTIIRER